MSGVLLVLNLEIFLRILQEPKGHSDLWQKLTFWFSLSAVTATSGTLKEVVGALGGSVTFPLNFTEKHVETIIWNFRSISLAIKAKGDVLVLQNHNKNRIVFPDGNYSMKLSQLKKSDSGVYRVEIHSSSLQYPFIQEYVLYVYGKQTQF